MKKGPGPIGKDPIPSIVMAKVGQSNCSNDLKNHTKRVRALFHLIVDDFIPILREIIFTYLEKAKGSRKEAVKFALQEWKEINEAKEAKAVKKQKQA